MYCSTQTSGAWYEPNTYPTPSATWGTIFQENRNWSYYVTYTV
ncbi:MAG: hypothetical protein AB7L13_19270 [Acidimicrobiia bacterium]